jgi:fused signal recognition particle receptor
MTMVFWRQKANTTTQDQEKQDDRMVHRAADPALEPPTEYEPGIDPELAHELNPTEAELIDKMDEIPVVTSELPDGRPLFHGHVKINDDQLSAAEQAGGGWLSRLTAGLTKSTARIGQGLNDLLAKKKIDKSTLQDLEDILVEADLGPMTAKKIITAFAAKHVNRDADINEIKSLLADEIEKILAPVARPLLIKRPENKGPFTILVCGVNGVGKTTTIGKLAKIMHDGKHHKVMMAAGDTFRAAAVEQLQIWGQRAHTPVVTRDIGADAAALAFEAYDQAKREGYEVLLVDTAGRLHNKSNLMAELEKINRVLKKHGPDVPHEVLLVLDGTTGQNAFAQVETFKDMVNITGLIVTKLDGSAKGGVVVGLADKFGLPIYAVGVGEGAEDLQPFTARGYARSLLGIA